MTTRDSPEIDMQAVRQEEEEKAQGFRLIGEFVFWFWQLEFTIKVTLGAALRLEDELFDIVLAPYDLAVLCTVTTKVLTQKHPTRKTKIEKVFNDCRKLNDERVRAAHGMWTHGTDGLIARHAARGTLEAKYFFEDPDTLSQLTETARRLMRDPIEVFHEDGDPPRKLGGQ